VERIGQPLGCIKQDFEDRHFYREHPVPSHREAFELMMRALLDPESGILRSVDEISGIGHRVVHGGEQYSASVVIDADVTRAIELNCELAPLHNPANLTGIRESQAIFLAQPQVAVFDTAFHQTLPPSAFLYGIPKSFTRNTASAAMVSTALPTVMWQAWRCR
jgi:acetate kinase